MPSHLKDNLHLVEMERIRQNHLWGEQNHSPETWLAILIEEVGEVGKAIQEARFRGEGWANYREELVQVAAVAVAMLESHDRDYERAAID